MFETSDSEIRKALHQKILKKYHSCSETLVIDELGLAHGRNRVDIAVLNGVLKGFEIKSSKDTLKRLPKQIAEYEKTFQKFDLVAAENHLEQCLDIAPSWFGVRVVSKGRQGAIHFKTIKRGSYNNAVSKEAMAHLLWRKEALNALSASEQVESFARANRKEIYRKLCSLLSETELTQTIKRCFIERDDWLLQKQF